MTDAHRARERTHWHGCHRVHPDCHAVTAEGRHGDDLVAVTLEFQETGISELPEADAAAARAAARHLADNPLELLSACLSSATEEDEHG